MKPFTPRQIQRAKKGVLITLVHMTYDKLDSAARDRCLPSNVDLPRDQVLRRAGHDSPLGLRALAELEQEGLAGHGNHDGQIVCGLTDDGARRGCTPMFHDGKLLTEFIWAGAPYRFAGVRGLMFVFGGAQWYYNIASHSFQLFEALALHEDGTMLVQRGKPSFHEPFAPAWRGYPDFSKFMR
jgi:hypothetical protein